MVACVDLEAKSENADVTLHQDQGKEAKTAQKPA